MLEDIILIVFGVDPYFAPADLRDARFHDRRHFPGRYKLSMIAVSLVVGFAAWATLNRTHWGKLVTAIIYDSDLAIAMGINVRRVFYTVFVIGAVLVASKAELMSLRPFQWLRGLALR